jgi:hypothetical protein
MFSQRLYVVGSRVHALQTLTASSFKTTQTRLLSDMSCGVGRLLAFFFHIYAVKSIPLMRHLV